MEWARPAEVRSGTLELDMLPNDAHEIRRFADLLDDFFGDDANAATVTP
jgi:hypothetical protein